MARVLRMPGVAASATEAVLSEWLVEESGDFAAADAIATVETEKAAVDIEADTAGRVLKTLVPPGAQVETGDPIAVLGEPGEQVSDMDALLASLGVGSATDVVVPERRDVPTDPGSAAPVAESTSPPVVAKTATAPVPPPAVKGRVFTSPLARKLAHDAGLPLDEINGTGPHGRILRRDVDQALALRTLPEAATTVTTPAPPAAAYVDTPHSRIRLATARRLTESKQQAPHFYLRATLRAEALFALRAEINQDAATAVSLTDLIVRAVAVAHRAVPEMNVVWTPDALRRYHSVDIAVAVATDSGLMTPVVRDVVAMSLTDLSATVRDLAQRARDGRLKQDELEGGTIAVTNLGMYGVQEFAAIINPPQSAILAVGAVRKEPVVEDGTVVSGSVLTLTLSVDHRPVDGVLAARWLAVLGDLLEHPVRVLI
jgi:pyruvate dehydrogenase E2 component (dihydrolipoamide acetyltransferase)